MPLYFRKRPGSKSIKANLTQRGLSSFTFTTGSKKGQPRANYNTSRGFSFSFPGTGIMWRQKGYGTGKQKNIVEERGYDLRTKEGRAKHVKAQENNLISSISVIAGLSVAWLTSSPHGLWAGYILFWLLLAGQNKSFNTLIWVVCAHLGALLGYLLGPAYGFSALESIAWGLFVGTFISSILLKTFLTTLFITALIAGIWFVIGEPQQYLNDFSQRLTSTQKLFLFEFSFEITPKLAFLWLPINLYSILALIFSFYAWGTIVFGTIRNRQMPMLIRFFFLILGGLFFLITWAFSLLWLPLIILLTETLPTISPPSFNLSTLKAGPNQLLVLLGFSSTIGIFVNRHLVSAYQRNTTLLLSLMQSILGFYWLPILVGSKENSLQNSSKIKSKRIKKMENSRIDLLKSLDFKYWSNKNPFYGNFPLNSSMKASLLIIQRAGYLQQSSFLSCGELVSKIDENINATKGNNNEQDDESLLQTFDLIHAWGGKMGRSPYVRRDKHGRSSRENFLEWIDFYKQGIKLIQEDDPQSALSEFCKIPQIGMSFGSKHLRFWGGYPILDTRMWLLLGHNSPIPYDVFIEEIDDIGSHWGLSWVKTEEALFGFSSNYFPNSELALKKNANPSQTDYEIAKSIQTISK